MSIARERPRTRPAPGTWIALAVGLILLLGLGAWALLGTHAESAPVTRRDITAVVPVSGMVVAPPTERADIAAPYEAPVAKVYATIGANVRRGEVLLELSLPNAQQAYQQARENVRAAETAYANAKREYDVSVTSAQKQLDSARAAERTARTSAPGSGNPAPTTGDAETTAPPSGTGADLASAAQARTAAEQALAQATSARDAALLPFRQQLEAARAEFAQAQSGRKMGEVKSPIRGTVLALNAQPGAVVGKDRKVPVATIVNLDRLEVQGEVRPAAAAYVKSGTPATLTVTEVPNQQFDATVQSLTTQVTTGLMGKTRYVALVHIQNRDGLVKPGMHGTVGVKAGEVKDALAVPNDALRQDRSGRYVVSVQRAGKWEQTIVEPGLSDGRYTEIKSGLQEGDVVQIKPKLL